MLIVAFVFNMHRERPSLL